MRHRLQPGELAHRAPRAAAPAAKTLATHAAPSVVSTTANVSPLAPWPSRSPAVYRLGSATGDASTILAADTHQMLLQLKEK